MSIDTRLGSNVPARDLEDVPDDDEEVACWKCGGSGYFSDCIDDMCHGEEECIHGDDSTCSACGGEGTMSAPAGATNQ